MAELKPCPFCGNTEIVVEIDASDHEHRYLVWCPRCNGMIERWFDTEEAAKAAWNRRADNG